MVRVVCKIQSAINVCQRVKTMSKRTYIRISPDIDVLCINSDSCCASAYGDEICNDSPWLGPRFSIVVPGIEECRP